AEHKGYWPGINAATIAVVIGQREQALRLARSVKAACEVELATAAESAAGRYWLYATLGEASLILGDWPEAEAWYSRAMDIGRGRYGSIHSSRRNARLLMAHLNGDQQRI